MAKIAIPTPETFPWDELREFIGLVEDMLARSGQDKGEAAKAVAEWLVKEIDFRLLFPGPVGAVIESVDDMAPGAVLMLARLVSKLAPFRRRAPATPGN